MQERNIIEHIGIVQSIDDKHVTVSIQSNSACVGCMASGVCDVSGSEEKVVKASLTDNIRIGEMVNVVMQQSLGFRALFIGYLLPFIIVMVLLIVLSSLSLPELVSGLVALVSLIPYYLVIYLRKEKIGKDFSFTIKKMNR